MLPLICAALALITSVLSVDAACQCGYQLADYGNAYFPFHSFVDFTLLTSLADLAAYNLTANIGQGNIGSISTVDKTTCYGSAANYNFTGTSAGLQLIVPGGQTIGGNVTGAELDLDFAILHGVVTAQYKLSAVPGTCQSIVR